jgi:hypothetical protein
VLFAACAYAQLNDPDPELWVVLYVVGGCVLALATVSVKIRSVCRLSYSNIRTGLSSAVAVYGLVGMQLAYVLQPKVAVMLVKHETVSEVIPQALSFLQTRCRAPPLSLSLSLPPFPFLSVKGFQTTIPAEP